MEINGLDYPPGSLAYERERLMREARAIVAALPFYQRWAGKLWLRRIERQNALLGVTLRTHQQAVVDDVLTWRDEDGD